MKLSEVPTAVLVTIANDAPEGAARLLVQYRGRRFGCSMDDLVVELARRSSVDVFDAREDGRFGRIH